MSHVRVCWVDYVGSLPGIELLMFHLSRSEL